MRKKCLLCVCMFVCVPRENIVSQFCTPSSYCVGVVSFRERDCGGRDLRGRSASLELARLVCEREGMGQRLTDGLSATWTAGRWL